MEAEFWTGLIPFATVLSAVATTCAMVAGGASLVLIARQTKEASRTADKTTAFDAHKEYLRFCIDHPQLSSSYMMLRYINKPSFAGILEHGTTETEKALWFLSYVLFAMEQLAQFWCQDRKIDPAWEATITDQLSYHAALLIEVWPEWRRHYSSDMDRLVQQAIAKEDPFSMGLKIPA